MARKSDGTVYIDTLVDTKGFGKGMNTMQGQINGLMGSVKKLGAAIGIAFGIKQLVDFGKKSIELGSDLQEVQNVVDVTFGDMSNQIDEFAKNAIEQFGLSELAAKQYSSTMGAMIKSMGFDSASALEMSKTLTGLAGDMASFYNLASDDAFAKIRAGISGETEPLKQLGINLSVANLEAFALAKGITKSYNAMTEQEKVMLRYNYLLNATADAQGDFARTSDSWANQTRILSEKINSIMATFGQGLINFFTPVIKIVNVMIEKLATLANSFKALSEMIMGTASGGGGSGTNAAAEALGELEAGYEGVADGAKDAEKANKKYLSGLDEIKTFASDSASAEGLSGLGAITGSASNDDENEKNKEKIIPEWIQQIIDSVKNIDFSNLKNAFSNLKNSIEPIIDNIGESLGWFYENILIPFSEWTIEDALPAFFNALSGALELVNEVIEDAKPILEWLWNNFLSKIAEFVGDSVVAILNGIGDALSWISQNEDALYVLESIGIAIAGVILATKGYAIITSFIATLTMLKTVLAGGELVAGASKLITAFTNVLAFVDLMKTGLFSLKSAMTIAFGSVATIITGIASVIGGISLAVMEFIDMFTNGFSWVKEILMVLGIAIAAVGAIILGAPAAVAGVIAAIVAVVATLVIVIKDNWEVIKETTINVWSKIKDFFSGMWNGLKTGFSNVVNSIKNGWINAWNSLKTTTINIFNSIWNGIKKVINFIIGGINGMVDGVVSGFNAIINAINTLDFDIPDWVPLIGGENVGFNIPTVTAPKIPLLASGAVIPPGAPFLAWLGDQKHGNNLEMPEDLLRKIVREETGGGRGNGSYQFTAQINRRTLFDEVIAEAKIRQTNNGRNPFELA